MTPDSALVDGLAPSPNFGERRGKAIDALILHYTGMATGADALARLSDPESSVSCHYLVWEDGRVTQLVAEAARAWHAGQAFWAGERDMNSVSIGIEIVNPGHDGGLPPYPDRQIEAVIGLCRDIGARHGIPAPRVLAHSDVAPDRKRDPGELFPWARLAAAGVGLWVEAPEPNARCATVDRALDVSTAQALLSAIGYDCPLSGLLDAQTGAVVSAFQRRYRPERIDGRLDSSSMATLKALWDIIPQNLRAP